MESPLTRWRTWVARRRLAAGRDAVVSGGVRRTNAKFFERRDRWSTALLAPGIGRGDRVACISLNETARQPAA